MGQSRAAETYLKPAAKLKVGSEFEDLADPLTWCQQRRPDQRWRVPPRLVRQAVMGAEAWRRREPRRGGTTQIPNAT